MAQFSLDNGVSFESAPVSDATWERVEALGWDTIVSYMDDDTREHVADVATIETTPRQFLDAYLTLAPDNLVIG
jgi:hypothetical protein